MTADLTDLVRQLSDLFVNSDEEWERECIQGAIDAISRLIELERRVKEAPVGYRTAAQAAMKP